MKEKFTKIEKSWIMYDWANSVYAVVVLAAIFPTYFVGVVGSDGDMWWGIGTSIATAIVAICSPFLGVLGDLKNTKKKLLASFIALGLLGTAVGAVFDMWQLLLVSYVISYIGFSASCMFYDSILTEITTPEKMDKVSAWGYSMGYIGGSTIPFLVCIALISFGESFGVDAVMAVKISMIITVLWWGLFSIPILKNYKQSYGKEMQKNGKAKYTLSSVINTFKEILKTKNILLFMIAYFFYIDGVNTVIKMSTAYGASLGLDTTGMIVALLVTQLIAFPCAILFGMLSKKIGTINMLIISICIYVGICLLGFFMGFGMEEEFLNNGQALTIFWVLAIGVGLVQGGIQALSRSFFGKLIPKDKSNEYFGIFDIFGKFAAVLGPAIYATVAGITGRSSYAILCIVILFIIGGLIMILNKNTLTKSQNINVE